MTDDTDPAQPDPDAPAPRKTDDPMRLARALAGAIYQATGKRLRQLPLDTSQLRA